MIRQYLTKLHDLWFAPAPPERLALLRISTGCFALWYLLRKSRMLHRIASSGVENFEAIGILSWMEAPLSADNFHIFYLALVGLNIAYILGWNFRIVGPLFAISLLVFFTYRNSWSMIYHNRNALIIQVLVLGWVASADALSVDAGWRKWVKKQAIPEKSWQYGWPVMLICAATLSAYFVAGVAKMAGDLALEWATGEAMRSQVAVDALRKEVLGEEAPALFNVLYPYTWLFFLMGVLTLVLELGAPFVLFRKRARMVWAVLTWMMHWGIFFIMGIRFRYQMTGLIFLPFFDIEEVWFKLKAWGQNRIGKRTSGSPQAEMVE